MNTENWLRANELFEQAIDLDESERDTWLERQCAGQPDLREEVDRRLQADAQAGREEFLDQSLMTPPTTNSAFPEAPPSAPLPERLGPYRIQHEIGCGGMGTVYAAERDDDAFRRPVAIKVITTGGNQEEVSRRLRAERRILALLEHPNIARIYDGGTTPDGRPYFVMERISGQPINQYCQRHHLSVEDRAQLLRQVCLAVAYAHQNLVVHRDLKPSNILVTEEGIVKLLDFGIAKVLASPHATATSRGASGEPTAPWRQHLTVAYASPEQLRGQPISTASDVYALGVLLFKLLTGALPRSFDNLSPWQVEEQLASTEVTPPSAVVRQASGNTTEDWPDRASIARQLSGDLDAIVLKALRTDPEARYRSAEQLADDLDRCSRNLPVSARRGTHQYRARKLFQRHRWGVILGAAMVLLSLGFVASITLSANRLARSQARLVEAQVQQQATLNYLLGIFKSAGPYVENHQSFTLLDAVEQQEQQLKTGALADQPAVRAALLSTTGWVYLDLGNSAKALSHHQQALELHRSLDPGSSAVAEDLSGVAAALREQWDYDRADELSLASLKLHREQPTHAPQRYLRSLNERVNLLCHRRDWPNADGLSQEALALARAHTQDNDPELDTALINRALALVNRGKLDQATPLYEEAEERLRERYGPHHPTLATLYNNRANLEARAQRFTVAADYFSRAEQIFATAFGDDHYKRVQPLTNLGKLLQQSGDSEGAEESFRAALDVAVRSPDLGPQHEIGYWGRAALALANLLASKHRNSEAIELLESKVDKWPTDSKNPIVTKAQALLKKCRAEKIAPG